MADFDPKWTKLTKKVVMVENWPKMIKWPEMAEIDQKWLKLTKMAEIDQNWPKITSNYDEEFRAKIIFSGLQSSRTKL